MHKRPRQTDVAKLAGVSPATVSVILNNRLDGNVRVSAETQARVWAAIEQLGYVVNPLARSLAGGQNALLGVFTFTPTFGRQAQDSYAPFLSGIEEEAEARGYDLILFTSISSADGHRHIDQGTINRLQMADGAILLGTEPRKAELQHLLADHYPFVFVERRELTDGALSYVAADYVSATVKIVTEMLNCGHRAIAYWGATHDNETQRDCYTGYLIAHRQAGLHHLVMPIQRLVPQQLTPTFVEQALAQGITAFVIEHEGDLLPRFFQVITALQKSAPAHFSLAVLGDQISDFIAPYPVTTFAIPRQEMGRRAVQLLSELLLTPHTPQVRQEILACTYASGSTIAPPPNFA